MHARIILLASRNVGVRATADELGIGRSTVQAWRRRWTEHSDASVAERLSDAPQPGTPPIFTAEQICAVVALACEDPCESGRAITHCLPPYAPNFNLIERLWKFFKKKVVYNKYYESFDGCRKACADFFSNSSEYKGDLRSLLTENFEITGR